MKKSVYVYNQNSKTPVQKEFDHKTLNPRIDSQIHRDSTPPPIVKKVLVNNWVIANSSEPKTPLGNYKFFIHRNKHS